MNQKLGEINGKRVSFYLPTREDIENLQVGDSAPDAFGNMRPVVNIHTKKESDSGKLFVCYYTRFGDNSSMSNSMKEGEIVRSVRICNILDSHECDMLQNKYK